MQELELGQSIPGLLATALSRLPPLVGAPIQAPGFQYVEGGWGSVYLLDMRLQAPWHFVVCSRSEGACKAEHRLRFKHTPWKQDSPAPATCI